MIKQPNQWSCFPTALAIITGHPVKYIIDLIGHDGSEIIYPNMPEPFNRRAFVDDEIVKTAWHLGYYAVAFTQDKIVQGFDGSIKVIKDVYFNYPDTNGIICTHKHALAKVYDKIIDPRHGTEIVFDYKSMVTFIAIGKRC